MTHYAVTVLQCDITVFLFVVTVLHCAVTVHHCLHYGATCSIVV